jgi:hypothetical protein
MPDVTLVQSASNNGTTTPATTSSITATAGNLLVVVIAALGTSPTIATPTGGGTWTQVQKAAGSSLSFAMYMQVNGAGGATNPSAVLGGTVTGWVAGIFEFTQTGANCGLQGSNQNALSVAQLTNIFSNVPAGQSFPNLLFVYSVARTTATITPANSGLTGQNSGTTWSTTVQPQAGVQGISLDTYWGSNLAVGPGAWPTAAGLLSGAVASVAIGAYFNTTASQPFIGDNVGGYSGRYVPNQFQGMIGG